MSAAKKTPQKKTPAKATQASTAKKIAKKAEKTLPKKGARKKATTKLASDKKKKTTTAKKTPAVTRRLRKKPAEKKSKQNAASKKSAEIVNVPRNVPLRSIEKAEVLRTELSLSWQKSMHTIAYVSGFCFLLIGATFAGANVFDESFQTQNNSALVSTAVEEPLTTKLTLQSQVPSVLVDSAKVLFTLHNVFPESVQYYFIHEDTRKASERKRATNQLEDKYSFTLSPTDLPSGKYKLLVQYAPKSITGLKEPLQSAVIATFLIPVEEKQTLDTTNTQTDVTEESATTQPKEDVAEPVTVVKTNTESVSVLEPKVTQASTTENTNTQTEELKPIVETENRLPIPELAPKRFSLYSKETTVSGVVVLKIIEASGFRNLELYARPVTSLNARFLARASERSGDLVFVINSESFLPNGTYEFYAKGTDTTGKQHITPSVLLAVKNVTPIQTTITPQSEPILAESPETQPLELNNSVPPTRTFAPLNLDSDEDTAVSAASDSLLKKYSSGITVLLKNYSSAQQSGDEMLIKAARESLNNKRVQLANEALIDKQLAGVSDDVIVHLSDKLADLQNRIDTFEQIRREKSAGQSATDSDGDGIPDYDEINLYRTNPNESDTDGDGFVDGIEIMRGFDPLNDTAETVIEFESPKESVGLVRADALVVQEVIPVKNATAGTDDVSVLTEIRGRGLPSSFVTLYIYSSPTIVTIKTDADGSFVYTLDKELEDGSHDVFVALTDNTGSIVAQSNPFSFIKEAQAFTPVDAAGGDVVSSDSVVQATTKNAYNAVIGLGVLAFGLILIMLGISLRSRKEELLASGRIQDTDPIDSESNKNTEGMTA